MKFMEKYNYTDPVPGWFNVDTNAVVICDGCNDVYDEAKESLNSILDIIDQISSKENISYDRIYLGGFSQGGIMTSYILLNSRHELGGYLIFSGYIFDHHFPFNYVQYNLTDEQKQILESKKDYHIIATHSLNDDVVGYSIVSDAYQYYFKNYTNFRLYNFGSLGHIFIIQPVLPIVKLWLKERMGK